MKRRKWKPEQKALIVLEGLKGRPIGELCAEHEISQAQYYQWRDLFLANAAKAFEPAGAPQRQGRLERAAYAYGRETAWPRVGERMLAILRSAASQAPQMPRSGPSVPQPLLAGAV